MSCLLKFPFTPTQEGYAAQKRSGLVSVDVVGGPSWSRLDTTGNPFKLSVSWDLFGDKYDMFMGYVRNWERSGGDPFLIDLLLEGSHFVEYQATFVPDSVQLESNRGLLFTVSAVLEVMPKFVDPCSDEWAARALIDAIFGQDACEAYQIISKAVRRDLVYHGD